MSAKVDVLLTMHKAAPDWAEWIAQDADGSWWAYEACPNRHDCGWYENETGRCLKLDKGSPNPDWMNTLRQRGRP